MTAEQIRRLDWLAYRVGLWIREKRQRENWTQVELAARLDVHRNRISRWESGEKDPEMRSMEIADFVQLCDLFGCDPGRALLGILREPREAEKMPPRPDYESEPILAELVAERDPPLRKKERARGRRLVWSARRAAKRSSIGARRRFMPAGRCVFPA